MAAERGSGFVVAIGDGGSPPTYAVIAGMRTTAMRVQGEAVEAGTRANSGWRSLVEGVGVRSMRLSAAGVFEGSAAEARLMTNAMSGAADDFEVRFESGTRARGRFVVTHLDYTGDHDAERMYAVSLESSGPIAIA